MPAGRRASLLRRIFKGLCLVVGALIVLVVVLVVLYRFVPPVSTLMLARLVTRQSEVRDWRPLAEISPNLRAAVIMSEDGQFCRHHGVDWGALKDVIQEAGPKGVSRGASTIAMQTARNLFLWPPSRTAIRKGLEIPLALAVDFAWGKRRELEIYLNVAQWGEGLYGAQAAAQLYFHEDASRLTPRQAALLATALPNPVKRNPARPSRLHNLLADKILSRMEEAGPHLDCLE